VQRVVGNGMALHEGGHVVASLSPANLFEASFLRVAEGPGPRYFIPNCELRLDHTAIGSPRNDPPLGSLIIAQPGISLMVLPRRSGPSPLRLTGATPENAYAGIVITRWRLQSSTRFGDSEILYDFQCSTPEHV